MLLKISLILSLLICITLEADPVIVSGGNENDYESWICRLNDNRLLVVFDRNPDWQSGDLYSTFSLDDGMTWSQPLPVVTDAGDQATLSFVQFQDGNLRLWYASNQEGGYRIYSVCSDNGTDWQSEGETDLGWETYEQYYDPNVVLEPDGSCTMSYVKLGGGAYVAHKPAGGEWDHDMTLAAPGAYRARIARLSSGSYVLTYHKRTGTVYEYDVFIRTSENLADWSEPLQISDNHNSHDPFILETFQGNCVLMYAKYQYPSYNLVSRQSNDLLTWDEEVYLTQDQVNNTQPHFFYENDSIYLIWAHAVDYPDDHDVYFSRLEHTTAISSCELIESTFSILPNPGRGNFRVLLNTKPRAGMIMELFDIRGRKLLSSTFNDPARDEYILDLSSQNQGHYFLRIGNDQSREVKKFSIIK